MLPEFTKGIIRENPLFVQLLGVCPALATTSSLTNALGMGAAFTAVLIGSNLIISALKKFIPANIRTGMHKTQSYQCPSIQSCSLSSILLQRSQNQQKLRPT